MTMRRQKNIADTHHALERALDQREVLLAKLVRCEARIRTLRKRSMRAQKAFVSNAGDPASVSVASGGGPMPYRYESVDVTGDLNDDIPI